MDACERRREQPSMDAKRMKCPKCGYAFRAANQAKGGKARWAGMSKAQRKRAASEAAKARWAKSPNAPHEPRGETNRDT